MGADEIPWIKLFQSGLELFENFSQVYIKDGIFRYSTIEIKVEVRSVRRIIRFCAGLMFEISSSRPFTPFLLLRIRPWQSSCGSTSATFRLPSFRRVSGETRLFLCRRNRQRRISSLFVRLIPPSSWPFFLQQIPFYS